LAVKTIYAEIWLEAALTALSRSDGISARVSANQVLEGFKLAENRGDFKEKSYVRD
jgi:hypothetical protein